MHVMFYRCFDRLLDSWIINEFLKIILKACWILRILQVTFQHFLKQIIPDYSNNHVFVQRMPFACFCTTTNVQDKTSVSLKDYVDLRKIMANKVLEVIITKNYNSSFWWQNCLNWHMFTRSCSRGLDCQCDIRLSSSFQTRLVLNFVTFMGL